MLSAIGLLIIAAIIALLEVPSLIKKKLIRELWVFSILLVFGTAVGIAHVFKLKVPNPLDWITMVYKPVSDVIFAYLK